MVYSITIALVATILFVILNKVRIPIRGSPNNILLVKGILFFVVFLSLERLVKYIYFGNAQNEEFGGAPGVTTSAQNEVLRGATAVTTSAQNEVLRGAPGVTTSAQNEVLRGATAVTRKTVFPHFSVGKGFPLSGAKSIDIIQKNISADDKIAGGVKNRLTVNTAGYETALSYINGTSNPRGPYTINWLGTKQQFIDATYGILLAVNKYTPDLTKPPKDITGAVISNEFKVLRFPNDP